MKKLLLFATLLPYLATAQPCAYLAYESFDYPANSPLDDRSGGTGWAEPWLTQNDDAQLPGFQTDANSLGFSDLKTLGGQASGGRAYLTAGRRLDTRPEGPFADFVADFENGIGTKTGATLWFSALLKKNQNNNQSVFTGLHGQNLPWYHDGTAEKIMFGYFDGHSNVGGQRRWTLRVGDNFYPTSVPVTVGSTVFFVLKIKFENSGTAVELFVNPSALGNDAPSPTPTMTQTSPSRLAFRSLAVYLGDAPGGGSLDEIRFSKNYTCAAPDADVPVNLPPVAVITASTTDGPQPLAINFSASSSYDPESQPLTYRWNFGDGSPEGSGVAPTHTYFYPTVGILTVRLTVEDDLGQAHTAFLKIKVRDGGSFPCQVSFTLLKEASCGKHDGALRINDVPENFALRNSAGALLTPINGSEYRNLAPGSYIFNASNSEGCFDGFLLRMPVDSTTCPGWQPADCSLGIGTNLSGFADWVPERPLRNLLKHARPELITFNDDCFCWDNGNASLIQTDPDGYPTHIPQQANGVPNKVRYVISTEGANLPPGHTYLLLYDGAGTVTVQGAVTVSSSTPGRIRFDVTGSDIVFFRIENSQAGNQVRNVRIVRLEDEFADLDAEPFYDGFLEKIKPFKVLRFMDWGHTNGNPARQWSERTRLSHFTYGTPEGVPYELMIQLANQTKKDVWICIPHAADSQYVAELAQLVFEKLDFQRNIYLEYSNEVWNWIFDQAHFNVQTAPSNLNYGRAYAEKARRVFGIWHGVFGGQKFRVKRVLGMQAGFNYLNEQILAQLDPLDWDFGSPTSYIGLDHEPSGQPVLNASSTPADILENARNNWLAFMPALRQDYRNVKVFGKEIVNYEGGQHFVGNVFGIPYPYQQAMWDAQYSPEIHRLYDDMLDTIRRWGSRMFGNFSLASPQASVYGSWGVLNDIDIQPPYLQTAPKYQALLDNICPDLPISTEDVFLKNENVLAVFPNPTTGCFSVLLPAETDFSTPLPCSLSDAQGRLVFFQNVENQRFEVPVDGLAAGIYVLRVGTMVGKVAVGR